MTERHTTTPSYNTKAVYDFKNGIGGFGRRVHYQTDRDGNRAEIPKYQEMEDENGETKLYEVYDDGHKEAIEYETLLEEFGHEEDDRRETEIALLEAKRKKDQAYADKLEGPVFDKERRQELKTKYDAAHDDYMTALEADIASQLENEDSAESMTDEELATRFDELVNQHKQMDDADQYRKFMRQGGRKARFLNWYSGLSKTKKIAYGAGAALVSVGAGAALGTAGVAVGITAGGLAGGRFARGYYTRLADMYKSKIEARQGFSYEVRDSDNEHDPLEQMRSYFKQEAEKDIVEAENAKRKAVKGAVAGVAVGAALGGALAMVGDYLSDSPKAENIFRKLNIFGSSEVVDTETDATAEPASPETDKADDAAQTGTIEDKSSSKAADVEKDIVADEEPDTAKVIEVDDQPSREDMIDSILEERLNAEFKIGDGAGYTHELQKTMQSLGIEISAEESYELHQKLVNEIGPDYINIAGVESDVYHMGGDQYQYGLSAAHQAQWDPRAIELLKAEALERGFGAEFAEVPTAEVCVDEVESSNASSASAEVSQPEVDTRPTIEADSTEVPADTTAEAASETGDSPDATEESEVSSSTPEEETDTATDTDNSLAEIEVNGADQAMTEAPNSRQLYMNDIQFITDNIYEGNIEAINQNPFVQKTLTYVHHDLGNLNYPDTQVPILEMSNGNWQINPAPEGSELPTDYLVDYLRRFEAELSSYA